MDMDKVVRRKQLLEMIGVSAATQYRMEKAGLFPARFRLGRGLVGWHLSEIEEWLKNRERVLVLYAASTSDATIVAGGQQLENIAKGEGNKKSD